MFEISALTTERVFEHDGIPVIKMTSTIPVVTGGKKYANRRINAYYGHVTGAIEKHIRKKILTRAAADFDEAILKSRPFEPYRIKMTFEIVNHDDGNTLEIQRRLYNRTGKGRETEHILTEVWNARHGLPDRIKSETTNYSLLIK